VAPYAVEVMYDAGSLMITVPGTPVCDCTAVVVVGAVTSAPYWVLVTYAAGCWTMTVPGAAFDCGIVVV